MTMGAKVAARLFALLLAIGPAQFLTPRRFRGPAKQGL